MTTWTRPEDKRRFGYDRGFLGENKKKPTKVVKVYRMLKEMGYTKDQAILVLAGFVSEVGFKLDPFSIQGHKNASLIPKERIDILIKAPHGLAIGVAQFDGENKRIFVERTTKAGGNVFDLSTQLQHHRKEILGEIDGLAKWATPLFQFIEDHPNSSEIELIDAYLDIYSRYATYGRGKRIESFTDWAKANSKPDTRASRADYLRAIMMKGNVNSVVARNRKEINKFKNIIALGSKDDIMVLAYTTLYKRAGIPRIKNRVIHMAKIRHQVSGEPS